MNSDTFQNHVVPHLLTQFILLILRLKESAIFSCFHRNYY